MSEADFAPYIREKAQQMADSLAKSYPYERSLVIHDMECILEDRFAATQGLPLQIEAEAMEDVADAAALWLGLTFHDLSSEARQELIETAQHLWHREKFRRCVWWESQRSRQTPRRPLLELSLCLHAIHSEMCEEMQMHRATTKRPVRPRLWGFGRGIKAHSIKPHHRLWSAS